MEENHLYNESPCFEEGVGSVRRPNVGFLHTHYCLYMGPPTPPSFFFYYQQQQQQQQQAQEYNRGAATLSYSGPSEQCRQEQEGAAAAEGKCHCCGRTV